MIRDMFIVFKKEIIEFADLPRVLLVFVPSILAFGYFIFFFPKISQIIKQNDVLYAVLFITGISTSVQFASSAVLEEKKNKNWEVLLSVKLNDFAIVLGKALLPLFSGLFVSLIFVLMLYIKSGGVNLAFTEIFNYLLVLIDVVMFSLFSSVLMPDEKSESFRIMALVAAGLIYAKILSLPALGFSNSLTLLIQFALFAVLLFLTKILMKKSRLFLKI